MASSTVQDAKSARRAAGKTLRTHPAVAYDRASVIAFLTAKYPSLDWQAAIGSDLPPVVLRRDWPKLAEKLGLPLTRASLANLDSQGRGPLQAARAAAQAAR